MSKYKAGDKVVIRKDLVAGECYGNWYWSNGKEYMKDEDYVVIERVDDDGDYWFNNECFITEEMIEGLYEEVPYKELVLKFHKMMKTLGKSDTEITKSLEEINTKIKSEIEEVAMKTKVKYKIGDKVVINKDLVVGEWYGNWCWSDGKEYMKDKDYVVIDEVYDLKYQVENGKIISHEMIEGLYEEKKDMTIEDLKKQIEGYFSNLIDDFKGELKKTLNSEDLGITLNKDMVNEAFMINVKEKENRVNELVLKILELNHDIKLSIGGK